MTGRVPKPRRGPDAADLPHALTFFLTSVQRSKVLEVLGREHAQRSTALMSMVNDAARIKRAARGGGR